MPRNKIAFTPALGQVIKALKDLPRDEGKAEGSNADSVPPATPSQNAAEAMIIPKDNQDPTLDKMSDSDDSEMSECSSEDSSDVSASDDIVFNDLASRVNYSSRRAVKLKKNQNSSNESLDDRNEQQYFCVEDALLSKDIKIIVKGIGEIKFPIDEITVQKLIQVSSKAKFGKGEETILDTTFRDTQMIPADDLTIDVNDLSLADVLRRIGFGLNINPNSTLSIHLHNLLVYGPGQFFKKHRDSEKLPNMVATLVMVLPFEHTGGDLVIEHLNKRHVFFGSKNPDLVKCIAFYADCHHLIKPVEKGYRIALTYNIVLETSASINMVVPVNTALDKAVKNYFAKSDSNVLIYLLNHMYSENSLRWDFLKGTDRTRAQALFSVARKQGRVPFLALATYTEHIDRESDDTVHETTFSCEFWINELNLQVQMDKKENTEDGEATESEICYTMKTTDLTQADKIDDEGPTGNEGHPVTLWYRRACIVLWANKWQNSYNHKNALIDIRNKISQPGQESLVLDEINRQSKDFFQPQFWKLESVTEILLDIVMYLGINDTTKKILNNINPTDVLKVDRIKFIQWISKLNDFNFWNNMINAWKKNFKLNDTLGGMLPFLKMQVLKDDDTVQNVLQKLIDFLDEEDDSKNRSSYSYSSSSDLKTKSIENLKNFFNLSEILKNENLEKTIFGSQYCKRSVSSVADLIFLKDNISLTQFVKFQSTLISDLIDKCFGDTYYYWGFEKQNKLEAACTLLKLCREFKNNTAEDIMVNIITTSDMIQSMDHITSLQKSLSTEQFSCLSESLLQKKFEKFMQTPKLTFNDLDQHYTKATIGEICSFFKVCSDLKIDSMTLKLKYHLMSSLEAHAMAYIVIQLKESLNIEGCISLLIDLANHALKLINDELVKASKGYNDWSINSHRLNCECGTCQGIKRFLNSKTMTKYVVPGGQKIGNHVIKSLGLLRLYLKMSADTTSRPHKLNLEKIQKVVDEKKDAVKELVDYKNQLLTLIDLKSPKTMDNPLKRQKMSEQF